MKNTAVGHHVAPRQWVFSAMCPTFCNNALEGPVHCIGTLDTSYPWTRRILPEEQVSHYTSEKP